MSNEREVVEGEIPKRRLCFPQLGPSPCCNESKIFIEGSLVPIHCDLFIDKVLCRVWKLMQNYYHNVWCISVNNTCSLSCLAYIIQYPCLMSNERSSERSTNRHANIQLRSYKLLEDAWLAASTSDATYDHDTVVWSSLRQNTLTPYDWQLDVTLFIWIWFTGALIGLSILADVREHSGNTIWPESGRSQPVTIRYRCCRLKCTRRCDSSFAWVFKLRTRLYQ